MWDKDETNQFKQLGRLSRIRALLAATNAKHLPGMHDQATHGNRYGSDGNVSKLGRAHTNQIIRAADKPRDAEQDAKVTAERDRQLDEPKMSVYEPEAHAAKFDVPVPHFTDVGEAEKYIAENYGVKTSLKGCDPVAIEETLKTINDVAKDYPDIMAKIWYITTYEDPDMQQWIQTNPLLTPAGKQAIDEFMRDGRWGTNVAAHCFTLIDSNGVMHWGLGIAPNTFGDAKAMQEKYDRWNEQENPQHPKNTYSYKGTIAHELGHAVRNDLVKNHFQDYQDWWSNSVVRKSWGFETYKNIRKLSNYACTNDNECFAEAFSSLYGRLDGTPKPRNAISTGAANVLKKVYGVNI